MHFMSSPRKPNTAETKILLLGHAFYFRHASNKLEVYEFQKVDNGDLT